MVLATLARLLVEDLDAALPLLGRLTGREPEPLRPTQATVVVASLAEVSAVLSAHGASVVRGPFDVPTGRALTARHGDGAVVEYVEWRPDVRERVLGLS